MDELEIRPQIIDDAKRFYEILNNDNFKYFDVRPPSVEVEKEFLKQNRQKEKDNFEYNFTILLNRNVVGAVGVKIDQHRTHIGEIGYFVDENYWGKGLAVKAVQWIENYCVNHLKLKRLIIIMDIQNKGSEKVAIKNGYVNEGIMKKFAKTFDNFEDVYLYAKTFD